MFNVLILGDSSFLMQEFSQSLFTAHMLYQDADFQIDSS